MPRLTINLTPAAITRLQHRRAAGTSLAALAAELGVSESTLNKRLKARVAITVAVENTVPVTKAHRTRSVPMLRRAVPPRPASPEPSKQWLREMIALAVRNTPHH